MKVIDVYKTVRVEGWLVQTLKEESLFPFEGLMYIIVTKTKCVDDPDKFDLELSEPVGKIFEHPETGAPMIEVFAPQPLKAIH